MGVTVMPFYINTLSIVNSLSIGGSCFHKAMCAFQSPLRNLHNNVFGLNELCNRHSLT